MATHPESTKRKTKQNKIINTISVVEAEKDDGSIEYKRQVHNLTSERRIKLTTQMSYRLDQGNGVCKYMIGIEDNGTHSLLDYKSVIESIQNLASIAANLNCIVLDCTMIQGEISSDGKRIDPIILEKQDEKEEKCDHNEEKPTEWDLPTSCEVVIQRVETHLIDVNDPFVYLPSKNSLKGEDSQQSSHSKPTTTENTRRHTIEDTLSTRNIRVAVVGNVDAGKSTLIGTLTTSCLDDGRGKSRTAIMIHRHEIESGRTSTATTHLMGFRATGEPIAGRDKIRSNRRRTEDEIVRESDKIVSLMDLAGHEKYLKTTIHGVASGFADYGLILVNSRHPPTHMTHHHLNLCCSYGIPVIVVFTKIDGCPPHARKQSKDEVVKLLRSPDIGKRAYAVKTEEDIDKCLVNLHSLAPVFDISNVTGEGMNLLRKMLFKLPKRRKHENRVNKPFEFLVEDIFNNVPGVGAVVSGFVFAGELTVGSNAHVYVGPTDDGTFLKTTAKSAHISRINTSHVTSGQNACLALALGKDLRKLLRRGMVVLKDSPTSTKEFEAEICVLKGEGTTIRRSYQAYVHILNVRQSAFARKIEVINNHVQGVPPSHKAAVDEENNDGVNGIILRPGSRAKVRFEFVKRPEYIRPGMKMLFRDGRVRGVGKVTAIPGLPTWKPC